MDYKTISIDQLNTLRDQYTPKSDVWHALSELIHLKEKKPLKSQNTASKETKETLAENIKPIQEQPYAFVDGSFNPKTNVYGFGGFLFDGEHFHILTGSGTNKTMASMRNVAGEILGAQEAMNKALALKLESLDIYYDYMGIEKWYTGEWQAKKFYTKEYAATARYTAAHLNLSFTHVKGHSGVEGNELADKLAKKSVGI